MTGGRLVIGAVAACMALGGAFAAGVSLGSAYTENVVTRSAQSQIDAIETEAQALRGQVAQLDASRSADLLTFEKKLNQVTREAAKYEPPKKTACRCDQLDPDWVRIHDAAAGLSGNTGTTGLDDDKARAAETITRQAVTKQQAIETVTDNYGDCTRYIKQLEGLQAFIGTLTKGEKK